MKYIGLIPARYASTRFPGKPLALLAGKPVVQWVYEKVASCIETVFVCTDDERILHAVEQFGGKAILTSPNHASGTDRCYEAYTLVGDESDVIINVQGDEPFIHTTQIESLKSCFTDPSTDIATLVKPFSVEDGIEKLQNPNSPKVVVDKQMRALYFSRSVVPYLRGIEPQQWLAHHTYYKHIGMYAYRANVLKEITSCPRGQLEIAESLEQLRWLEHGYTIRVGITNIETIGIDTPDDLEKAKEYINTLSK